MFVPFICSSIKRVGQFFQRQNLRSDSKHCRRLRFFLSERSVCTSFKQKCSYLKHCHGDLKASFISAQKLCCEINGEVKHSFSEFRICGNFSFASLTVFRGPHLWCLLYFLHTLDDAFDELWLKRCYVSFISNIKSRSVSWELSRKFRNPSMRSRGICSRYREHDECSV